MPSAGLLREAIATRFGADWPTSTHEAGLHMVMHLPAGTDDLGISMAARTQGLSARPLSRYYSDTSTPQQGLLLGYACVPEETIGPAFHKLAEVIEPALEHSAHAAAAPGAGRRHHQPGGPERGLRAAPGRHPEVAPCGRRRLALNRTTAAA